MDLSPASFFSDVAGGLPAGQAHWVQTSDGLRIRVGHWRPDGSVRGTILLFPGRSEYIEKYAGTAARLAGMGYATVAVDWRGQGLADRLTADRRIGHIDHFPDYQRDVECVMDAVAQLDLPQPWHLLGHSMGGAIGLRAVLEGLPVASCVFSGPMWGIYMTPVTRAGAKMMTRLGPLLGQGLRLPPNTVLDNYVTAFPFAGNVLTTDPDMYAMMGDQLSAHPELGLGGPSLIWLREALKECRYLARQPSPDLPCLTFLGSAEKIIDCAAVRDRMAAWPRGTLDVIDGAEHEVLMEIPAIRDHIFQRLEGFLSEHEPA